MLKGIIVFAVCFICFVVRLDEKKNVVVVRAELLALSQVKKHAHVHR